MKWEMEYFKTLAPSPVIRPTHCPKCGNRLQEINGVRRCPFCGWDEYEDCHAEIEAEHQEAVTMSWRNF